MLILLSPIICELRVFKTSKEIEYLRMANLVSSKAHIYVMRHCKVGMTEIQLEALFKAYCAYYAGSRHVAYTCICGAGPHGSILHYGHAARPNERLLYDNDRVLLDMGAEYNGYASDITRSYPVNGKFTTDQKLIRNAVYDASKSVINMKQGIKWTDMHLLAERTIIKHLLQIGILYNGTQVIV